MLKRFISIILVLLLVFNFCKKTEAIDVSREKKSSFFSDEFGDYYEDENLFIVVQKINGRANALAVNFKDNNIVREYIGNDIPNDMNTIIDKIKKNKLSWTNEYENYESTIRTRSGWQQADVQDKLERGYGREYYDKYIHGKNVNGIVGSVYEDKQFEIIYDSTKYLRAGMKIVAIIAILGVPGLNLTGIISTLMTAHDVYVLVKDISVDIYFANVNYNREAKINGRTYDTAGKTIYGKVVFGDIDSAYTRGRTTTSGYFDDTNRMIDTAVYIYNTNN